MIIKNEKESQMMKRIKVLVMVLVVCLVACMPGFAKEKIMIKLAHPVAANNESDVHVASLKFAEYVNDHSKTIEVKIYPNGQLGNERDEFEGMQLGSIDCRGGGTAIMGNFIKQFGVLDLPFVWKSYAHYHHVIDGVVGKKLSAAAEKAGVKVLSWFDSWGYRHVISSKKVTKPADLKGMKIRCIETPTNIAAIKVMGANATPMAFGEVYTALQTGVIDGMEHCSSVLLANKFYEVAKNVTLTGHLFGPLCLNMSMKTWNKLSAKDKKIVMAGAKVAANYERSLAPVKEKQAFDKLKELGVTITSVDTTAFKKAANKFNVDYAKKIGAAGLLKTIERTK
jgi:tripartite ATP-independent transporter DctP family solute receptor